MVKKLIKTIHLPFPLPTWNRLLACNHWQRRKIRHFIHDFVQTILSGGDITDKDLEEYDKSIRPKAKKKGSRKKS
jgi:hypothetical protein